MKLRDLIVVLDESSQNGGQIEFAAALARKHDAHLSALCPLDFLVPPVSAYGMGPYPGVITLPPVDELRARAEEKARPIEARFRESLRVNGLNGSWELLDGFPSEEVLRRAHASDLVIIGQKNPDDSPRSRAGELIEDLLLAAGRPLLVIPYAGTYKVVGENVLIGWKETAEAARAVHDALPLIAPSAKVTVLSVQRASDARQEEVPGVSLAEHLARHGLKPAATRTIVDRNLSEADALLDYACDNGCDLLVIGGYGHSRTREILLGGVTRSLLGHMTLPVLMSH